MEARTLGRFRGECKLTGGKLVAVSVELERVHESQVNIASCRIDGDFFVESASDQFDLIKALESCIEQFSLPVQCQQVEKALIQVIARDAASDLIGASGRTIALALCRALAQAPEAGELVMGVCEPAQGSEPRLQGSQLVMPADMSPQRREDLARRWRQMPLQIILDTPRPPAEQLALDLALAEAVQAGIQPPTLRVWQWSSPAVVIGRFQSLSSEVDVDQAHQRGFTIVRRVTGGGAMFAQPSNIITYSLYLPIAAVQGLDASWTYRLCDLWLVEGLNRLGIHAGWSGMNDIASSRGKIGGAAERRLPPKQGESGALLHHDMLSYDIDTQAMLQVLKVSDEKMRDKAVPSAQARVDPLKRQTSLSKRQLVEALVAYIPQLAPQARLSKVSASIEQKGQELAATRFARDEWIADIV
ncbi:lipoate--protein ligase A [Bombiscardovia apis]|uniref:Lipoate--protein ligase A n=1 Tax=Bombiscardovia apis TaxID=2932182 RepID=A0ABM8BBH5_9BIFI|nr:lipoate--protein ligase family protein [Bombiscardovia apis]BDR54257.1 lipoate--protein ligase A [Bombiscardovia apis]